MICRNRNLAVPSVLGRVAALRTNAEVLQSATQDAITTPIIYSTPQKVKWGSKNIFNPATLNAPKVVVLLDIAVEARLAPAEIKPVDRSHPAEQVEIAVDGAKADLR
jgi:hypothetical protein